MKKVLSIGLSLLVTLCFSACGEEENKSSSESSSAETTEITENISYETTDENTIEDSTYNLPEGVTFAQYLFEDFKSLMNENPDMTAEELAGELSENEAILFDAVTAPVEEGFLQGFDSEITGFKSGVMFAPFINAIPFVGYVFELSDESEAEAFTEILKSNANPVWQVCVEAEETVCEANGNKVFFVMSPLSNQ